MRSHDDFDVVNEWSEVKLEILEKYAAAYSRILTSKNLRHFYIDGFAGAGQHVSKTTGETIPGSPIRAFKVAPPFDHYYLVDLREDRTDNLKELIGPRKDTDILTGDCNQILLERVFPNVMFEDYRRALCILDPYGLHLAWEVIKTAGQMNTIDMFLNFPVMDMNMNALHQDPANANPTQTARMTRFWGDETWRDIMYTTTGNLFGYPEKERNEVLVEAFAERLRKVAGFKRVPAPMPMRNSRGAVVYYLFFAAQVDVAENIVNDIFSKHR
jgi:three-Cys-motif partner protein